MCPLFSIFRKILHFQPCFSQNFSSQDANFRSQDPSFFKENLLPRPYFWKPIWHIPTKNSWVPPFPRAWFWQNHIALVAQARQTATNPLNFVKGNDFNVLTSAGPARKEPSQSDPLQGYKMYAQVSALHTRHSWHLQYTKGEIIEYIFKILGTMSSIAGSIY